MDPSAFLLIESCSMTLAETRDDYSKLSPFGQYGSDCGLVAPQTLLFLVCFCYLFQTGILQQHIFCRRLKELIVFLAWCAWLYNLHAVKLTLIIRDSVRFILGRAGLIVNKSTQTANSNLPFNSVVLFGGLQNWYHTHQRNKRSNKLISSAFLPDSLTVY